MNKVWWTQITNASFYIKSIAQNVTRGKNVILQLSSYLPWYDTMRELIEEEFENCKSNHILKFLMDRNDEPGEIILREYCKKEIRDDYRPGIGYANFLANCDSTVLNERFVWVTGIPPKRYNAWIEFVSDYERELGKGRQGGVFILEMKTNEEIHVKKGIQVVSFSEQVGIFDCFVFNMLVVSSINESLNMKQYLAELVSSVVGNDIELATCCMSNKRYKYFLENPLEEIRKIEQEEYRSNGECFDVFISEDEVERCIWNTQIKRIFPIIEEYRGDFTERFKNQIQNYLPIKNYFQEEYTIPNEVEIGTLYYMVRKGMINISTREKQRLKVFKNARNQLAHLRILTKEQVEEVFYNT